MVTLYVPPTDKLKSVKNKKSEIIVYTYGINLRQDISIARIGIRHTFPTHSFLMSKDHPPKYNACQTHITILNKTQIRRMSHRRTSTHNSKSPAQHHISSFQNAIQV